MKKIFMLIIHDYIIFFSLIMSFFCLLFTGYYFLNKQSLTIIILTSAISLFFIIIIIYRLVVFIRIVFFGVDNTAEIVEIQFYKDRGKITYSFIFNSKQFIAFMAIKKTKKTQSLKNGDIVKIKINQHKVSQSIILDIIR